MLEAVTEACWSPILALPARALARIEVGLRGSTELRELRTFLRCWLPFLSLSAVSKRRRTRGEQQRQRTKGGGRRKRHPAPWKTQRGAVYREGGDRNAVALERAGTSRCTRDDHGKAVHFQSSDCKMDLRFVQYFVCTNKYTRRAASSAPSSNLECCCSCKYMWTIVQHDGPKHLEMWLNEALTSRREAVEHRVQKDTARARALLDQACWRTNSRRSAPPRRHGQFEVIRATLLEDSPHLLRGLCMRTHRAATPR